MSHPRSAPRNAPWPYSARAASSSRSPLPTADPAPTMSYPSTSPDPATIQQYGNSDSLPPDLAHAMRHGAPAPVVYLTAEKYYQPVVLAHITSRPYSGAPLVGFQPKSGGERVLLNGFSTIYHDDVGQKTVYLTLDELMELQYTCHLSLIHI